MPTTEQGEALYRARLERARKAKELYERTGEVVYQPLVDPKAADPNKGSSAGLPGLVVWQWHFKSIPTEKKKLIWNNEVSHFQHYNQPDCVDRNVGDIAACFSQID
ncbi:hypothetical protein EYZ11_006278 [Aspergillus tanneri]|uniref:Uncharacterized protein n=1 Tax=Aspergillus tanneri TaxID=1220188 RepID=A0A4S3JI44_9EURO|nr:hypothetical protein EYZ11_006278 [Aspergillus tanneri]